MDEPSITTAFELPGRRIVADEGVVRGITAHSRSIVGNFVAGLQTIRGGCITVHAELCERTRQEALRQMVERAEERGANAIVGMRYGANEVLSGVPEVLCYGTAVVVEPDVPP